MIDVYGQTFGPIFSVQAFQEELLHPWKMGLIGCPETSIIKYKC